MITPDEVMRLYAKCLAGLVLTTAEGMQLIDAVKQLSTGIVERDVEIAYHVKDAPNGD